MDSGDKEPKTGYFFHDSLKAILGGSTKPLFSHNDNHEPDKPSLSSESEQNLKAAGYNISDDSKKKEVNFLDLKSWKEFFFFSACDSRLKDGVKFFKGVSNQNNLQFNEVRKKLKQSVRHKLLKRRSFATKKKFNNRNFKKVMYKKIK